MQFVCTCTLYIHNILHVYEYTGIAFISMYVTALVPITIFFWHYIMWLVWLDCGGWGWEG